MKKLKFEFFRVLSLVFLILVVQGCMMNGEKMKSLSEMTPKERVVMAYGAYNFQFASYMTDTGWVMNLDGKWEKVSTPDLSEDQKIVLRKKKEILTKMWPLIKIYDSMTLGLTSYSEKTEQELFNLIDSLVTLVPG